MSEAEEEIASAFSFPDLPTVEQQIRAIEAPIQARYADEIVLDPEVVDEILRTGSNRSKGQLRLIYNFMVEKTPEEYTEFVKNEYGTGGKGFEIGGAKYAVWFDDLGLRILKNEVYTGTMVQGRRQKINYKIKKIRDVEESGWIRVPNSFNEKVETIRKAKAEMNRQRDCLNNLDVEHLPWIEDFKSYQNLTSLNRRVLVELVESITVYDKEHIHIQYRFDQEIRNVLEYCSSVPAAETEESAV